MKSASTIRLSVAGLLLAGAIGVWLAGPRPATRPGPGPVAPGSAQAAATPGTPPAAPAQPAPADRPAPPAAENPASPGSTPAPAPPPPPAVTDRFPDATTLAAARRTPQDGLQRRVRLVRTDFKYPLIRLEERLRTDPVSGDRVLVGQTAAVGDHVIVQLEAGTPAAQLEALAARADAHIRRQLATPDAYLVAVAHPDPDSVEALVTFLSAGHPGIRYAEFDAIVARTDVAPNDPSYNLQWHLPKIGMPQAWSLGTGSRDVVVAVIDTGIDYNHPDLAANIWINPGETLDGFDSDGNGYINDIRGWNFFANNNTPMDFNGHGTHIAGIIGAVGNNALGIAGINWNVGIMALRVFSDTGQLGFASDITDAFHYATTMRLQFGVNVRVINASWGGNLDVQSIADAIAESEAAGILVVCAAGNSTSNNDVNPYYPANYPNANIIAVANTTASDDLAQSSNYGANRVHLGAPGTSIYSTDRNGAYTSKVGTSMAAPMVTGVAALLWSIEPTLSVDMVKGAILAGIDPIPALDGKTVTGGRLNAARAVEAVTAKPPVVTAAGIPSQSTDGTGFVTWELDVSDPDRRAVGLTLDYSTNGADWVTAPVTAATATTGQPALAPGHIPAVTGIDTGGGGFPITNRVTLTWASRDRMAVTEHPAVRLRVVAWNGLLWSAPADSAPVGVDNVPPSAAGAALTFGTSTFGNYVVTTAVHTAWSGFTDAGSGIDHYYVSLTDGGGTAAGAAVDGTAAVVEGLTEDVENTVYVWAVDHAGNIGPAASAAILALSPDGDYDGNGVFNLAEEIAGTDATDSASTFQLRHEPSAPPAHGIILHWQSTTNRFYTLHETVNLASPSGDWTVVPAVSNLPGTGGTMSYTGQTATATARFYRLEVAP